MAADTTTRPIVAGQRLSVMNGNVGSNPRSRIWNRTVGCVPLILRALRHAEQKHRGPVHQQHVRHVLAGERNQESADWNLHRDGDGDHPATNANAAERPRPEQYKMYVRPDVPRRRVRGKVVEEDVRSGGKRQEVAERETGTSYGARDGDQHCDRKPEEVHGEQTPEEDFDDAPALARESEPGREEEKGDAKLLQIDRRRKTHRRGMGDVTVHDEANADRLHQVDEPTGRTRQGAPPS